MNELSWAAHLQVYYPDDEPGRGQWWSGEVVVDQQSFLTPEEARALLENPWDSETLWDRYTIHWDDATVRSPSMMFSYWRCLTRTHHKKLNIGDASPEPDNAAPCVSTAQPPVRGTHNLMSLLLSLCSSATNNVDAQPPAITVDESFDILLLSWG